jgi:thiosulfate dehydrogenase (quinone) large subunit
MNLTHISLLLLRFSLGSLFFYAGITKVLDSSWTSAGYLNGAKTFPQFYSWLASPELISLTNFVNEWGLTLLGLSLLLGLGVRLSGILGAVMMILFYFPVLEFPYSGAHSYLVDEHIVYAAALLVLVFTNAGKFWGLEGRVPFLKTVFR